MAYHSRCLEKYDDSNTQYPPRSLGGFLLPTITSSVDIKSSRFNVGAFLEQRNGAVLLLPRD